MKPTVQIGRVEIGWGWFLVLLALLLGIMIGESHGSTRRHVRTARHVRVVTDSLYSKFMYNYGTLKSVAATYGAAGDSVTDLTILYKGKSTKIVLCGNETSRFVGLTGKVIVMASDPQIDNALEPCHTMIAILPYRSVEHEVSAGDGK